MKTEGPVARFKMLKAVFYLSSLERSHSTRRKRKMSRENLCLVGGVPPDEMSMANDALKDIF